MKFKLDELNEEELIEAKEQIERVLFEKGKVRRLEELEKQKKIIKNEVFGSSEVEEDEFDYTHR